MTYKYCDTKCNSLWIFLFFLLFFFFAKIPWNYFGSTICSNKEAGTRWVYFTLKINTGKHRKLKTSTQTQTKDIRVTGNSPLNCIAKLAFKVCLLFLYRRSQVKHFSRNQEWVERVLRQQKDVFFICIHSTFVYTYCIYVFITLVIGIAWVSLFIRQIRIVFAHILVEQNQPSVLKFFPVCSFIAWNSFLLVWFSLSRFLFLSFFIYVSRLPDSSSLMARIFWAAFYLSCYRVLSLRHDTKSKYICTKIIRKRNLYTLTHIQHRLCS